MLKKRIYLDYAAATPMSKGVLEAMKPYFSEKFGNPNSLHSYGAEANLEIEKVREKIKTILEAGEEDEIIFTSSATESNNLAIQGVVRRWWRENNKVRQDEKKPHIIVSQIEHDAVIQIAKQLEKRGECTVTYLGVDKTGLIKTEDLRAAIKPRETILVSIIHGHYQFGTIQNLTELIKICRDEEGYNGEKILFHTDAAQSFGVTDIKVKEMGIDLLTASGAKIYGPKGIGFLYKSQRVGKLEALLYGGGQEMGQRSGTLAVPLIVGMGAAVEEMIGKRDEENRRLSELRDYTIDKILMEIEGAKLNGVMATKEGKNERLPSNIHFSFPGAEGEALLLALDAAGIAVSTGSACSSLSLEPDHSLLALGLGPEAAHGSLRITLGRETKKEDLDYLVGELKIIVKKLRELSPLG